MAPTRLLEGDRTKGNEYDLTAFDGVTTTKVANTRRSFTI
jgi:hypothetical protein